MEKTKLVSVIIPFYNGAKWLEEAIESIFNQTYSFFEIIVINDGSPENIDYIKAKFSDKVIFLEKENGGPASARNMGLKKATGDYIAFLDADDVWVSSKTAEQLAFMEANDIMWSHTGYFNWYPEENKLTLKNNTNDYGDVYLKSFISLRAPTPSIIIHRKIFNELKNLFFFEDMRYSEDSALWSRIAKKYKLGLLNIPLVKIRQRGENADLFSTIRFKAKKDIYNKINDKIYTDIPSFILIIYKLYIYGGKVLDFLQNKLNLNKDFIEIIGKLLWITPFLLERVYLLKLLNKRDKDFIK